MIYERFKNARGMFKQEDLKERSENSNEGGNGDTQPKEFIVLQQAIIRRKNESLLLRPLL